RTILYIFCHLIYSLLRKRVIQRFVISTKCVLHHGRLYTHLFANGSERHSSFSKLLSFLVLLYTKRKSISIDRTLTVTRKRITIPYHTCCSSCTTQYLADSSGRKSYRFRYSYVGVPLFMQGYDTVDCFLRCLLGRA